MFVCVTILSVTINTTLELAYISPSVNHSHYYYAYIHKWMMINNHGNSIIVDIFITLFFPLVYLHKYPDDIKKTELLFMTKMHIQQ